MIREIKRLKRLRESTGRRFVTRAELDKLGLGHLVGTPLLRAFMHGYFLHNRLWNKARAIAQPFAYDDYRQQRIVAKLEAERKSRIGLVRKLPKVCYTLPAPLCTPVYQLKTCTLYETADNQQKV